jgi:class 3 adenylate cyclase/tetratricopeptide (TPR) repeat protein
MAPVRLSDRPSNADTRPSAPRPAAPPITAAVPRLVVESLAHRDRAEPAWIEQIEGTLLLADISGFTPLSERLARVGNEGAEWLTTIINNYFERMLDIARALGGDNLKFGGDALLILFRGQGHADRALTAGLAMQRANRALPTIRLEQHRVRLRMSVGLHSDHYWSAATGVPGLRMQHLLLGRGVAEAARAQGLATAGEVVITGAALQQLGFPPALEPRQDAHLVVRGAPLHTRKLPPFDPASLDASTFDGVATTALAEWGLCLDQEGDHRKVTVVFISLRGANELLDEGDASAVLTSMQEYVATVARLTHQFGGFLISNDVDSYGLKFIIVFGAPVAHEDPAASALRLALALRNESQRWQPALVQRIGVNSGYVFCGDAGTTYRREYTMIGDAVNLSARLMANASPGTVLISEQVADEAGPAFITRELPALTVKGKALPVPVRLVEGEQNFAGAAQRRSAFVGRNRELAILRKLCARVEAGEGAAVAISGEVGIGTTRLAYELEQHQLSRGWRVIQGYSLAHRTLSPFGPWVQLLSSLFGIDGVASTAERSRLVLDTVRKLSPELLDYAPLLNSLLDVDVPMNRIVRSIDDETRSQRLMELIAHLIRSLATSGPVALALHDLQWADRSSIQLLNYVAHHLEGAKVMVCCTHREDPVPGLELSPEVTTSVVLQELDDDSALGLLRSVLDHEGLGDGEARAILARSQRNPLFLEEVARALRTASAMVDSAAPPALPNVAIPDRLQSLLMASIDALPPTSRQVVRLASVIGTTFDVPVLAALAAGVAPTTTLTRLLRDLVGSGVILPPGAGAPYRFRHSLLQEVAYESLPFARRRALHHEAAVHIEETNRDALEPHFESLARHYKLSRDFARTVTYAVLAGDKARRVFATETAVDRYEDALAAITRAGGRHDYTRSQVDERVGDCHEVVGRYKRAGETYRVALREWRAARHRGEVTAFAGVTPPTGDEARNREASLCTKIAVALERSSDYDGSLRWLDRAWTALPPTRRRLAAEILGARSIAFFRKGRYAQAIHHGRQSLRLAGSDRDTARRAYAHLVIGNAQYEMGDFRGSVRHRLAALRLYEETGNLSRIFAAQGNLGVSYRALGQLEKALSYHRACLATTERIGNAAAAAMTHINLGEVLLMQGRLAEAAEEFEQTVATHRRTGHLAAPAGMALVNLSRATLRLGRVAEATAYLEEGTEILRGTGARGLLLDARVQQAELELATGHADRAVQTARRAVLAAEEIGSDIARARALFVAANASVAAGDVRTAEQDFVASAALARELAAPYEEARASFALAQCLVEQALPLPKRTEARRFARRATVLFARLALDEQCRSAEHLIERLTARATNP